MDYSNTHSLETVENRIKPWQAIVAGVAVTTGLLAYILMQTGSLNRLVNQFSGPPQVVLQESFADRDGESFDHRLWDQLVRQHVDSDGWVNYEGFAQPAAREKLNRYLDSLATAELDSLGRDQRLALLINAYNAFTVQLILDHWPLDSIKDIPASKRWDARRWTLNGREVSLDQIEHEMIRPRFAEPRIHFALVCAAVGCPPLRQEAFTGDQLEKQLADQTRYVHQHATWFQPPESSGTAKLTELYSWYGNDFEQADGSIWSFIQQARPDLQSQKRPDFRWLPYDWSLNDVSNRQPR